MADEQPVRLVLTTEQREILLRLSGQNIDAIELTRDEGKKDSGPLSLLWRLSAATGIPRQNWFKSGVKSDAAGDATPPK